MNNKNIFITTPIFYPNDKPHLGTAYTLIIADFFKRYYSLKGYNCFLSTGTDEHGKKVADAAAQRNLTPEDHVTHQRKNFMELKELLDLNWDEFIYTSHPDHIKTAQHFWTVIYNKGYIYKGVYRGWYSWRDEQFFKESELIDGKAPSGSVVELMEEECYFFKLKDFKEKIMELYENSSIIKPHWRAKEILNNIKNHGLEDLCISRHKSRLNWGIPVPNDENHIMYVWFDALTNYLTVLDYPHLNMDYWSNAHHIIGKDIVYFHGVIWPAMLMAADLPIFKELIVHGWLTINNEKMSKSLGNVVDPIDLCKTIDSDYLKYFLLREIPLSSDYNFDINLLINRVHEELADKIGNLVNRVSNMVNKYCDGVIPLADKDNLVYDDDLMDKLVESRDIHGYIQNILNGAIELNKYIDHKKPWSKDLSEDQRNKILYNCCYGINIIGRWLYPVTPKFSGNIIKTLGCENFNGNIVGNKINNLGILIKKIINNDED
jgi:methionyl-tRNA synthetase